MDNEKLPNLWLPDDRRIEGLLHLSWAANDAFELATHGGVINPYCEVMQEHRAEPDLWPIWAPLELARKMREAADRIEAVTSESNNLLIFPLPLG